MRNLAGATIDLLCAITFPPQDGDDPETIAELEQSIWQTLIHDLSSPELEAVTAAIRVRLAKLEAISLNSLEEHQRSKLSVLKQFLDGELQ